MRLIWGIDNLHLSCRMTKPTKWPVCPAKTQTSESLLSAWRKLRFLATHWVHSEDSDQTGLMPRLIWVFAGCIGHFVGFDMRRLIYYLLQIFMDISENMWTGSYWTNNTWKTLLSSWSFLYIQNNLTLSCLASYFWDLGKQCRPRSDAAELGSDQGQHFQNTGISIKNKTKNEKSTPEPLKWKMDWSKDICA